MEIIVAKPSHQQFHDDAECLLSRLHLELASTRSALGTTNDAHRRQINLVLAHKQELARMTIPNLEPRTIAVLKRDYPNFMEDDVQGKVAEAIGVKVPFWTWLMGGAKKFRQDVESHCLNLVRIQFSNWLGIATELPAKLSDLAAMQGEQNRLHDEERTLLIQEHALSQQIAGIERAQERYRMGDKPVPQELRDAMNRSSNAVREQAPSHSTQTQSKDDGFTIIDYLILDSILNPDRGEHHDHRHEDSSFSHAGHRHDDGPRFEGPSRDKPLSGGSFEVDTDHDDRGGGGGSFRVDTSNDDRDGGGGSFRTTAQPDLGSYS